MGEFHLAFFADASLGVGFFFEGFGGLGDGHGHVIVLFVLRWFRGGGGGPGVRRRSSHLGMVGSLSCSVGSCSILHAVESESRLAQPRNASLIDASHQ